MKNLPHKIITILLLITTQMSLGKSSFLASDPKKASLMLPGNKEIQIQLAVSEAEQVKGLSGTKSKDFKKNQGLFFFYFEDGKRGFWMPDTYFNLDIIFLDKDLKIVHIARDVKAHPGLKEPPAIARTPEITCRHVLEIRADSGLAKNLKVGQKINWLGPLSLSQTELKIRPSK